MEPKDQEGFKQDEESVCLPLSGEKRLVLADRFSRGNFELVKLPQGESYVRVKLPPSLDQPIADLKLQIFREVQKRYETLDETVRDILDKAAMGHFEGSSISEEQEVEIRQQMASRFSPSGSTDFSSYLKRQGNLLLGDQLKWLIALAIERVQHRETTGLIEASVASNPSPLILVNSGRNNDIRHQIERLSKEFEVLLETGVPDSVSYPWPPTKERLDAWERCRGKTPRLIVYSSKGEEVFKTPQNLTI